MVSLSNHPSEVTILEIAKEVGAALAAPASADSAAKGKSRVADRRRKEKRMKKNAKIVPMKYLTARYRKLKEF